MEKPASEVPPEALLDYRLDGVRTVLRDWTEDPPAGDDRISSFATAAAQDFDNHGHLFEFWHDWLQRNPEVGSSHAVTHVLRAIQSQLYGNYPGYPAIFTSPEQWRAGIDWIHEEEYRYGQFFSDAQTRPLQSNKSERYKSLRAFGVLAKELGRIGTMTVMDVGASQNAGLNHIASGIGFTPPTLVWPWPRHDGTGERPHASLRRRAAFDTILNHPLQLGPSVGIDRYWPEDSRNWARACSFYPSALLDAGRLELFEQLVSAHYPNVGFFNGDFADFDDAAFTAAHPQPFEIVHFSTSLYQASEEGRATMLRRARRYAQEFIIVQDFLRIDPDNPQHLIFRDNWTEKGEPFPYRTVVQDMREDTGNWHEVFLWHDGFCDELALGVGRIAVATFGIGGPTASVWSALDRAAKHLRRA